MKKQIILTGAACGLLAVLPAVGVFAAETVDTVNVTVNSGCNVAARDNATANLGSVNPGSNASANSPAISITCNNAWTVTPSTTGLAITSGTGTAITSESANGKGSQFKLALAVSGTGGTINNSFSTANTIGGTNKVTGTAAATALTLTPTYSITIGQAQEPGTYSGTVTYNIAAQ